MIIRSLGKLPGEPRPSQVIAHALRDRCGARLDGHIVIVHDDPLEVVLLIEGSVLRHPLQSLSLDSAADALEKLLSVGEGEY